MSGVIYVTVIISCHENKIQDCLSSAFKFKAKSLKEEGCISLIITQPPENLSKIILLETYTSHAAFEQHQDQPYTAEFGRTVAEEYAKFVHFHMSSEVVTP
ncbi:MAG: hypothetical protein COB66_04635 [Coxiella sp. (in: Bacteria)]|nr:MAG: hypothetical protein COB66_04635 [Coxiella sp. (in: g-proteobacteria)]